MNLFIRILRLGIGVGLLAIAIYGWRFWDFHGVIVVILGLVGLVALLSATQVELKDDPPQD